MKTDRFQIEVILIKDILDMKSWILQIVKS